MARDTSSPRSSSALIAWAAASALAIGCTLDTEGGLSDWMGRDAGTAGGSLLDASADQSVGGATGTGGKSGSGGSSTGGASGHGGIAQSGGSAGHGGTVTTGGAAGQGGEAGSGTGGQSTCPGECTPGASEQISCGSGCSLGVQLRECSDGCLWTNAGDCVASPECSAGVSESKPCGCGGQDKRACLADCTWGDWQGCAGDAPACTPGEVLCDCTAPEQGRLCAANGCPGPCANVGSACITCGNVGAACTAQTDCCEKHYCITYSGSTEFHKCAACKAQGADCYGAHQCCSGSCSGGSPGKCQ